MTDRTISKRVVYIDRLKSIVIMVILGFHAIFLFNRYSTAGTIGYFTNVQYQDALLYLTYPWINAVLFLLSGMTSRYFLQTHSIREYLRKRTVKLLVPSTVGILIYHWMDAILLLIGTGTIAYIKEMTTLKKWIIIGAMSVNALWFIQVLWLASVLVALVAKIGNGRFYKYTSKFGLCPIIIMGLGAYLSFQVLNIDAYMIYPLGIDVYLFFAGYFVFAHEEVQNKLMKHAYWLLAIAVCSGVWYTVTNFGEDFRKGKPFNGVAAAVFMYYAVLALLGLGKKYLDKESKLGNWLQKRCYGIYIFHYGIMVGSAYLMYENTYFYAPFYYLIVAICGFFGALAIHAIVSKIPILNLLLLGKSSRKEENDDGISQ